MSIKSLDFFKSKYSLEIHGCKNALLYVLLHNFREIYKLTHLDHESKQNFVDCFSEKGFRGANICQMPILQSKYNSSTKINLSPCLMFAAFDPGAIFPQSNHNHELNFDCFWKTLLQFLRDKKRLSGS